MVEQMGKGGQGSCLCLGSCETTGDLLSAFSAKVVDTLPRIVEKDPRALSYFRVDY